MDCNNKYVKTYSHVPHPTKFQTALNVMQPIYVKHKIKDMIVLTRRRNCILTLYRMCTGNLYSDKELSNQEAFDT